MALNIYRLNSCVVLLFSFALLHLVQGKGNSSTPALVPSSSYPVRSSSAVITSVLPVLTISPSATQIVNPSNTQTVQPSPNTTATTSRNATASTNATAFTNATASMNATGSPVWPSKITHIVTTQTYISSPTQPMPTKKPAKDKDDDSMKKRMWVAASFAILFAITTVILAYLVYRQRKINRELEGDPQTSRLL